MFIDKVGDIETVATAVTVQAPVPDKTVYVVLEVGETVTVAALAGFVPVLAVQVNGPEPEEDKVMLSPKQIVVFDGVMLIGVTGEIDTVATACAVQAPVPDITVYVVVELGVTVTLAALAGAAPELAVQVNGPAPEDDKFTLSPKQIVVFEGVIFIDGVEEIETVATAEAVQDPVPNKTV